jgi:hypothetical protein
VNTTTQIIVFLGGWSIVILALLVYFCVFFFRTIAKHMEDLQHYNLKLHGGLLLVGQGSQASIKAGVELLKEDWTLDKLDQLQQFMDSIKNIDSQKAAAVTESVTYSEKVIS